MTDAENLASEAARAISAHTGVASHDIALLMGSGWAGAVDASCEEVATIPAGEIPGFADSTVPGHSSAVRSLVSASGARLLLVGARRHFYEGRNPTATAHPVRTAAAAGCRILILTNAAGSTRPEWGPGSPVVIADHINLTGASPLEGPRFVDMTEAYSPRLRSVAHEADPTLPEGIYAQFPGPQYETPAEVRAATALGADLIGMSTALEVIAARAEGLEVLALSLVTNLAAGVAPTPLSHDDVLAAGEAAAPRLANLLARILDLI